MLVASNRNRLIHSHIVSSYLKDVLLAYTVAFLSIRVLRVWVMHWMAWALHGVKEGKSN